MRVRCKKVKCNGQEACSGTDGWFTVGTEYVVIGISFNTAFEPKFLLLSDKEDYPVLREASFFEIVDSKISGCWRFSISWSSKYDLEPEAFDRPHFWEEFHDGREWARTLFRDTYESLVAEDRERRRTTVS